MSNRLRLKHQRKISHLLKTETNYNPIKKMKKGIFTISEKHERITIRYKRTRKSLFAICDDCGKQSEWLTIDEAANLSGTNANDIRQNLIILRKENHTIKH